MNQFGADKIDYNQCESEKGAQPISNDLNPEILDKLTKVCLCKGISRATIKKVIADGADSFEKVQKATGAVPVPAVEKDADPK